MSNRNLLVIADVLAVNKGFAKANPEMVKGLVHGILEGNRRLRDNQAENIAVVAKAFKWTEEEARDELAHVHLSNAPENRAFFAGTIDSAGSFGGIFQSSVLAYGSVIKNPADPARFVDTSFLDALAKRSPFSEQKIAIAPIRTSTQAALEGDPLLSKDIRFFFEPNSSNLDRNAPQNQEYLQTIKRFLQVSPGSTVLLRGHVDNARVERIPPVGRRAARAEHGAQGDGAVTSARDRRERRVAREISRRSTRVAWNPWAVAGKSRPARPTARRTGASKCSGSRSNSFQNPGRRGGSVQCRRAPSLRERRSDDTTCASPSSGAARHSVKRWFTGDAIAVGDVVGDRSRVVW